MLDVGLIGAGYFSRFHIEAWQRLEGVTLRAIAETDMQRRQDLALAFPEIKIYASYDDLLSAHTVDIIDIATPPATHAAILSKTIGVVPTLICQKPFCASLTEAETLRDLAADSSSTLVIHENFRFQPWYRQIKSCIDANELGEVLQAGFQLRPGDGAGEAAYLDRQPYFRQMNKFLIHETGIHWVDVFRFLFGMPETVYGDLRQLNPVISGEDAGFFIFGYPGGTRAVFDGNRLLDHAADNHRLTMGEFQVEGSRASLKLTGDGELTLRKHGERHGKKIDYAFNLRGFGGDCVYNFQKHVVDHCRGHGKLENQVDDYLNNLVLENLIYESAGTGQRRVVET